MSKEVSPRSVRLAWGLRPLNYEEGIVLGIEDPRLDYMERRTGRCVLGDSNLFMLVRVARII